MDNLLYMIEYLREEMQVTALEKGISHPDVMVARQRLDEVINELYKSAMIGKVE